MQFLQSFMDGDEEVDSLRSPAIESPAYRHTHDVALFIQERPTGITGIYPHIALQIFLAT